MAKQKNPRFGELLKEGINNIKNRQGKNKGAVEREIDRDLGFSSRALRDWQRGRIPSEEKIEKLARYCVKNGRVTSEWLEKLLYHAGYSDAKGLRAELFPPRLFISYQRGCKADENIVWPIVRALSPDYDVFSDQFMRTTPDQIREMEKKLREADYVLFLFSTDSIHDEVVRYELDQVLKLRRSDGGWPRVLPVWLRDCANFLELVPSGLESFKCKWAFCEGEAGTARLISELQQAISGGKLRLNISDVAKRCQKMTAQTKRLLPPSPHISQLRLTKGTVRLDSEFYIEREVERRAHEALTQQGRTIVLKGPRQMGKSSMLPRLEQTAIENGKSFVLLDCKSNHLKASPTDAKGFFSNFCKVLTDELAVEDSFRNYAPQLVVTQRCTRFIGRVILPHLTQPCVIALDNSESLFHTTYGTDFFAMLRGWHDKRAYPKNAKWRQLDLVVVTSTEPHLFIDKYQSPFNVGEVIELQDFTPKEVDELNRRYGKPLSAGEVQQLIKLVAGHPYLVRKALFLVASERFTASDLFADATDDMGLFGDHLRAVLRLLYSQDESLRAVFREIIRQHKCTDEMMFYRLRGAGLVRRQQGKVVPRNALYAQFFKEYGI